MNNEIENKQLKKEIEKLKKEIEKLKREINNHSCHKNVDNWNRGRDG